MESEIPKEVAEKIKSEFEKSPSYLKRGLKGDYENIRPYGALIPHVVAFGNVYELIEYQLPLLDTEGRPLVDEAGKREFRIIGVYFTESEGPYTFSDLMKREK